MLARDRAGVGSHCVTANVCATCCAPVLRWPGRRAVAGAAPLRCVLGPPPPARPVADQSATPQHRALRTPRVGTAPRSRPPRNRRRHPQAPDQRCRECDVAHPRHEPHGGALHPAALSAENRCALQTLTCGGHIGARPVVRSLRLGFPVCLRRMTERRTCGFSKTHRGFL